MSLSEIIIYFLCHIVCQRYILDSTQQWLWSEVSARFLFVGACTTFTFSLSLSAILLEYVQTVFTSSSFLMAIPDLFKFVLTWTSLSCLLAILVWIHADLASLSCSDGRCVKEAYAHLCQFELRTRSFKCTPDNPRHSFLRRLPAYAARSGNFETFLEIFSTLFCKNWRESPWKHSISEK